MQLGMDPETLEAEAQALEGEAADFAARMDARIEAALNMTWVGLGREAWIELITNIRESFRIGVEEQLAGVGGSLRGSKDAYVQTDTAVASGISGTT